MGINNGIIQWSPGVTLEAVERQVVEAAYAYFRQNKTATAQALGIAIRTLDSKLEKYADDRRKENERWAALVAEREAQQRRLRGLPDIRPVVKAVEPPANSTLTQPRIKPASSAPAQHAVPVPERSEVQGVLPEEHGAVRKQKGRRRVS